MITISSNYFQSYGVIPWVGSHFLSAQSSRGYVEGLLSLAYITHIVADDIAHIVAKHAKLKNNLTQKSTIIRNF